MANPALKATQSIAAGDNATDVSDHAAVRQTDGSSRASKRKPYSKDSSCGIYLEMFSDAKLMLTPAVVLERVTLPELQRKEIHERSRFQPEVDGLDEPVAKTPVQRENAVKRLKQDLQKLKHELDKERTWHKNHESYAVMVEQKHQRKDETVESVRSSQLQKQTNHEVLLADGSVERKGNNQLQKQGNHEALLTSPFWIKVEEASNAPNKKVYYVFSGVNGTLNPNSITVTNLPCSVNRHQGEGGKAIQSTSNNPHETKSRKTNEAQGDGEIERETTMLHMLMYGNPDEISESNLLGIKPMTSNEEQGDGRIERVHTTPNDTSNNSLDDNKNRNSNEGKARKRKSQDSMVLVLTMADGKVKYKCTKCRKCFRGERYLLRHIAAVHSLMSYECNLCRTHYKDKKQFNLHLNVCHKTQFTRLRNECRICGKHFNSRSRHEEHMAFHAQKIFGCNACKASFVELVDLKGHLPCPLATAGMPAFLCLKCDETFDTRTQIQRHAACNHSLTPKTANDYKKSYSFSQKEKTAKYKGKQYACETCGKRFRLVQALGKHLPCALKICEVCDKQFESKAKLDFHMRLCHSDQAVKCSLCGSRFVSQRKLNAHEKLFKGHCQGQLFVCNYCGQTTRHASGFSKHVQTHERKMPGISKNDSRIVRSKIKLETDLSDKFSINAQEMVGCESDPEFLSVD